MLVHCEIFESLTQNFFHRNWSEICLKLIYWTFLTRNFGFNFFISKEIKSKKTNMFMLSLRVRVYLMFQLLETINIS